MARVRLFTAIPVGKDITATATALQQRLARTGANVRWVADDQMHITLHFLGEVDERDMHGVCQAVKAGCKRESAFRLCVAGIGAFPTLRRPKTVWGGVTTGDVELRRIHAAIIPGLMDVGAYRHEDHGYTPHLTLGRVADEASGQLLAAEIAKHPDWDGGDTMVDRVLVMSSDLQPTGPLYSVVGRFDLRD
jgi:RNA 2',3'-cyclic 3'-phosphodiesterase